MASINRRAALSGAAAVLAVAASGAREAGAAHPPIRHLVEIRGFTFVPQNLDVRPGDMIVWFNRDLAPHTASSLDGSWDTGPITSGMSAEMLVTAGLPVEYHCSFHPEMKARLGLASR